MKNYRRTIQRPLFTVDRPIGAAWTWNVAYDVASSGYPTRCVVNARRYERDDALHGVASCDVELEHDLREVIEFLAIEAMLAACEPTLDGSPAARRCVFSPSLVR